MTGEERIRLFLSRLLLKQVKSFYERDMQNERVCLEVYCKEKKEDCPLRFIREDSLHSINTAIAVLEKALQDDAEDCEQSD